MASSRLAAAVVVAALAPAGCGGGDDPASVAEEFGEALIAGDGETACELLGPELAERAAETAAGSCSAAFGPDTLSAEERERGEQASYETVDEGDGAATVEVTVPEDEPAEIELIEIDGEWRISSI